MSITDIAGSVTKLVVSGGFCTFSEGVMTVLADSVDTAETVDRQGYAKERDALIEQMKGGGDIDPQWLLAQEKLARIDAIDRLLSQTTH
jgi:F0F1-type ATP synthase epsilon subunit